jgi:hypothetical protein
MSAGRPAPTLGERFTLLLAVLLGLFGFVMIAGALIGTLEGSSNYSPATNALLALLLGVTPMALGVVLYRRVRGRRGDRERAENEAIVLRLAAKREGVVTAVDIAAESGLPLETAEATLALLHRRGFNTMDVLDSGIVVYRFPL